MKYYNLWLVAIGLICLTTGFYRMGVIKFDRRFMIELLPILIVMAILVISAYRIGGNTLVIKGIGTAGKMFLVYLPILIFMFLMMGQATTIIDTYKSQILVYLGGNKGIFGSLLSAYVMPGSITSMPIVRNLWDAGANKGALMVFLLSSSLVNWQVALFRQPILGWRLTAINFLCGSLISGAIALGTSLFMRIR